MNLTKQQKILGAVLGLGLGAAVVDRLILTESAGGPDDVAAADYAVDSPAEAGAAGAAAPGPADVKRVTNVEGTIAHRLAAYADRQSLDAERVRDAFQPSAAWVAPSEAAAAGVPGPADGPLAAFAAKHRLMAVMGAGATAIALVDGQPVRLGQSVGGMELVEVRQRSAVFAGVSGRVELRLASQP